MNASLLAGVMGWPVAHSRSPLLHGYWLKKYQINGYYAPLAVRPENLAQAIRALPALGFVGCNLTVPHKEAALAYLDIVEERAQRIGSVNTIVVKDGRLEGRSTDGYGFLENLKSQAPNWRAPDGTAVILGAGGSARAIAAALKEAGVPQIIIVNRTIERAEKLVSDLGGPLLCASWEAGGKALSDCRLLINTTTQGMIGQSPLNFDITRLPTEAVVVDIVYTPLETPLLRMAKRKGHTVVDGLGMLLHQARPGFAAWFGVDPQIDDALCQAVLQTIPQ